jgi:hypothetical protein
MTDEITLTTPSLAAFLDRLGLSQRARERVVAIDRALAGELENDNPDVNGCASLVLEAADLIADRDLAGLDWSGWDDEDGFEFVGSDGWDGDFAERMSDLAARAGGDSDWGEGGVG